MTFKKNAAYFGQRFNSNRVLVMSGAEKRLLRSSIWRRSRGELLAQGSQVEDGIQFIFERCTEPIQGIFTLGIIVRAQSFLIKPESIKIRPKILSDGTCGIDMIKP